jgi:beta-1,3-galactosyltransferase 1
MGQAAHKNNSLSEFYARRPIGHPLKLRIVSNTWNLCPKYGSGLNLLMYVFVRADAFSGRDFVRRTWANRTLLPTLNVGFAVGLSDDAAINLKIIEENDKYGDVIQGDFLDTYRNLTYKSIMTWRWIKHNCMHARYFVKIDDDLFANTPALIAYLHNPTRFNPPRPSFSCLVWINMDVLRDPQNKYFMSVKEWPEKYYLPYCSGMAFVMTSELPAMLYDLSFTTDMLWIDDANVGVLAARNKHIKFVSSPNYFPQGPWSLDDANKRFDWFFFDLGLIGNERRNHERLWELVLENAYRKNLFQGISK